MRESASSSWWERNSLLPQVAFFIAILAVPCFLIFRSPRDTGTDITPFLDKIRIFESRMVFHDHGSNHWPRREIAVLGKIRNDSQRKWRSFYFEIQCFNKDGELIDSHYAHDSNMVLLPGVDQTFALRFSTNLHPSEYATHLVFVRDGTDRSGYY